MCDGSFYYVSIDVLSPIQRANIECEIVKKTDSSFLEYNKTVKSKMRAVLHFFFGRGIINLVAATEESNSEMRFKNPYHWPTSLLNYAGVSNFFPSIYCFITVIHYSDASVRANFRVNTYFQNNFFANYAFFARSNRTCEIVGVIYKSVCCCSCRLYFLIAGEDTKL